MVPIGDHPILWHIMRHYRAYGVRDFVLCLGYKGEVIRDYFLNFRHNSADLEVDLGVRRRDASVEGRRGLAGPVGRYGHEHP